ncbi:MAG TPA: peroxiredoxin [Ruminiclostridium sp.]|nr:peroxiredoxin [Ruminiclostridium sp.]
MSDYKGLMIGEKAPHFQANTTYGQINFPEDYKGKWVVFFSHPGDFTPVCTTEIMTFANMADDFKAQNAELLGLSIDSNPSHIDWSRAMEKYSWKDIRNPKITFPIVADDFGNVARMYGMLMPAASATRTVRNVFIIDPNGTIRAILVYPLSTGRNTKEIMRMLLALQAYDKTGYATPADWMPGDPQVMPAPSTMTDAVQRLDEQTKGAYSCLDWYICFTKGTKPETVQKPTNVEMTAPKVTSPPMTASPAVSPSMIPSTAARTAIPGGAGNIDMQGILRMMGAEAMMGQQPVRAPALENAIKQATERQMPAQSPTSMPQRAQKNQPSKMTPPQNSTSSYGSGIMEQNRLLFPSDDTMGLNNEYMITRDYPNNGR